uniref:Uncharacterized protein n=1 Tax=Arundo donax TaxID=35708 RepID=A0A0A9AFQ9_ARUDO
MTLLNLQSIAPHARANERRHRSNINSIVRARTVVRHRQAKTLPKKKF